MIIMLGMYDTSENTGVIDGADYVAIAFRGAAALHTLMIKRSDDYKRDWAGPRAALLIFTFSFFMGAHDYFLS